MTALEKYARLEALGSWRDSPVAAPREVVVSFGDSTLVLTDLSDLPLAHWALASTQIIGATAEGTVYSTDAEGFETLTIRDRDMAEAIAAVGRADLRGAKPSEPLRRRRNPVPALLGVAAAMTVAAFGPDLVRAQAARMVSPEQAAEFGDRMLIQLISKGGAPCEDPSGRRALAALAAVIVDDPATRMRVLDLGPSAATSLPGGTVLLDRETLVASRAPEEAAGWIALALSRDTAEPAVSRLMRAAGFVPSLSYVFSGDLNEAAIARGVATALELPGAEDAAAAMDRLRAAGLPTAAFAEALRHAGLDAAEAPPESAADAQPLTDQQWVALQGICG